MPFILDGLDTEDYDRRYSDRELLSRIVSYFKPHKGQMILVVMMLTLNSLFATAGPILIAKAIDLVAVDAGPVMISWLTAGVFSLGVAAWFFNFIRQYASSRVVGNVVLTLREDAFKATIHHDMSFYDQHPSGKIVARITSDTQDFSDIITLVMEVVSHLLVIAILLAWVAAIHIPLTLLLVAMMPVAILIALSFRRIARKATQRSRRVNAKINAQIQESISGITVAKSFRREKAVYEDFSENNAQAYQVGLRRGLILNIIFPVMNIAAGLGTAAFILAGSLTIRKGALTPGDWYLFMQAVALCWWPLISIASFWSQFQDGLSAAERVFSLIDAEPRVIQSRQDPVREVKGGIEMRQLRFAYDDRHVVLPDLSLTIAPGETVAFVGHTGAGKSSIVKLITRFYEFQGGNILIDGRDIRTLSLSGFRRFIGLVPQDPFLFEGSVADNIRFGQPDASRKDIEEAAEKLGNGAWVSDLADGLETPVGTRGANLSMGQRQLVALARVILKDPAIFILDEATASVDPFTEARIQEGLETVMAGRTSIVIAHRLSTVKTADRIVVMEKGKIAEMGTHQQLMEESGYYAELYNTYFRHQSMEYIEHRGFEQKTIA